MNVGSGLKKIKQADNTAQFVHIQKKHTKSLSDMEELFLSLFFCRVVSQAQHQMKVWSYSRGGATDPGSREHGSITVLTTSFGFELMPVGLSSTTHCTAQTTVYIKSFLRLLSHQIHKYLKMCLKKIQRGVSSLLLFPL